MHPGHQVDEGRDGGGGNGAEGDGRRSEQQLALAQAEAPGLSAHPHLEGIPGALRVDAAHVAEHQERGAAGVLQPPVHVVEHLLLEGRERAGSQRPLVIGQPEAIWPLEGRQVTPRGQVKYRRVVGGAARIAVGHGEVDQGRPDLGGVERGQAAGAGAGAGAGAWAGAARVVRAAAGAEGHDAPPRRADQGDVPGDGDSSGDDQASVEHVDLRKYALCAPISLRQLAGSR